jgi:protein-disulfide isomerase
MLYIAGYMTRNFYPEGESKYMCGAKRILAIGGLLLFMGITIIATAQERDSDLMREMEILRQGQKEMQKELMEIKNILAKSQSPAVPQVKIKDVEFEIGNCPIQGNGAAKVMLIEFTDYQCPFCGRHVRDTQPQIFEKYIKTGKIRHAVVDQPLAMHKMAQKAAEAVHCAADQGKFWEMHTMMMLKQEMIENLSSYANALMIDSEKYDICLKSGKYKEEVENESSMAVKLGIMGVPGFVIGLVDDSKKPVKVKGISFIAGAQPFANFQKQIEDAIATISAK